MTVYWYWSDLSKNEWKEISTNNAKSIEDEYKSEIKGTRTGQRVYHCFGDGGTACIDFTRMQTYCGSGRCMLQHEKNKLSDNHMTFSLKRVHM